MALARSSCTLLPQAALALAMDYCSNAFGGAIMGGQVDQVAAERRVITPARSAWASSLLATLSSGISAATLQRRSARGCLRLAGTLAARRALACAPDCLVSGHASGHRLRVHPTRRRQEGARARCSETGVLMYWSSVYGFLTYTADFLRRSKMPNPEVARTARVEARIAPDALAVVRRAAELQGRSVSDFLVAAALKDAQRTIEDVQIIRLSIDDQTRFADLLLNPPHLAPAMKRALKARRRLISSAT